jgi:hypothetical protein
LDGKKSEWTMWSAENLGIAQTRVKKINEAWKTEGRDTKGFPSGEKRDSMWLMVAF